jgi:FKBP-type peptidyl-prolyl cis-trans isomerase FkpA
LIFVCLLAACESVEAPQLQLETEDQKTVYALGYAAAQGMANFAMTEEEARFFVLGFTEAIAGTESRVDIATEAPRFDQLSQRRMAGAAEVERAVAEGFLAEEAAVPNTVRLDSGLLFREITLGEGDSPSLDARVKVHYHGTLRDGTVFDSSVERGKAAQFPVRGVIACWTEALQRMKPGGKAVVVCPADIAYGNRGAGANIKPGAALKFEVELIEVYE